MKTTLGQTANSSGLILSLLLAAATVLPQAARAGTWLPLNNPPPSGLQYGLVLGDGSVMCANGGTSWYRLAPNSAGSYINGTWTQLASMHYSRLFFSSDVLTNGFVYVAGGEYGGGPAELYNPLANTWTVIKPPSENFSDAPSKILPNGNVLQSDSQSSYYIYNALSNIMMAGGSCEDMNETCWVRMPNDNILAVTGYSTTSEHYVPSLNAWYTDNTVPVEVFGYGGELGPAFALPNGKVFQVGATVNTAIYTPGSTLTAAGTWVAGPQMIFGTNGLGGVDAPGAEMITGNVLVCIGPTNGFSSPCSFYEYNYISNNFTQENAPGGGTTFGASAPFGTSMLCLPDGTVLFFSGQGSTALYVYTPSGAPLAAGKPSISSIAQNADGSFLLTGVGLNGITGGAAYGDDWQMDTSYPLVRMTNSSTSITYYARTYNWSSTTIQNPNPVTTDFVLPTNLPAGTYSLVASVMGNTSSPYTFTYAPPPVPTGLNAASGSNGFVVLNWSASSGATSYVVKRSSTLAGYFSVIGETTGTSYTNTGLTNGLAYFYKVDSLGSGGPSADSAAAGAKPAGPPAIAGATNVTLPYNRAGIYSDGTGFSGGFDGGGTAFSANLLGPTIDWNNVAFQFGPSNASDVVVCTGQKITLPAGRFNSLQFLAAGIDGAQSNQTFTVTYSDSTTATFTQTFSDWASPQSFEGEFPVVTMPSRDTSYGGKQVINVSVDAYAFTLNPTKTVSTITLPVDSELIIMAMNLSDSPVSVPLDSYYDRAGIYTDGTSFTNPATGGIDGDGNAYSDTALGTYQIWSNMLFAFGPLNNTNVISCTGQAIPLPTGNYTRLAMLGTAVNGAQTSKSFIVTYSDNTTATFSQSFSDWFSPQNYAGETKAVPMFYRLNSSGGNGGGPLNLYGYSFALNSSKTVSKITLPNDANVVITAISLYPDWPPTFNVSPFTLPDAFSGNFYSQTVATNATDPNGLALTYAYVSGPSWLNVAANGVVSGTPAVSNANNNTFVVSVTDAAGLSSTATFNVYVYGQPSFTVNPFTVPSIVAGNNYSGTIATNVTDPNTVDTLTFGLVSGPDWLSVGADGTLSGEPYSADDGTNSFEVSVTDAAGLSSTGIMYLTVTPAPSIVPTATAQGSNLNLSWTGGIGPFQIQTTTNLADPNWVDVGDPITGNSVLITPTNSPAFYQVVGN